MGNCFISEDKFEPSVSLSIYNFKYKYSIGIGGLGKVWKVYHQQDKKEYAMKQMMKRRVVNYDQVESVMNEYRILSVLNHPFIVNMKYAFHDSNYLYLALDYMVGGDLRFHLCQQKKFTQSTTRFFTACIVLGLEYLHSNRIIHKDIKPENLVLDQKGYLKITDFGIATVFKPENREETQGSPGYTAPQVLFKANHRYQSDFFGLGVIVHQLLTGQRPYSAFNRTDFKKSVLQSQAKISKEEIGQIWSQDSADFFNRLIQRNPRKRLGRQGIEEIKSHPWLKEVDWNDLARGNLKSPFVPKMKKNFSQAYIKKGWNEKKQVESFKEENTLNLFQGYFFDHRYVKYQLKTN